MIIERLRVDSRSGFEEEITIFVPRRKLVLSWWSRRRKSPCITVGLVVIVMFLAVAWHDGAIGSTGIHDPNGGLFDQGTLVTVKGTFVLSVDRGDGQSLNHVDLNIQPWDVEFYWTGVIPPIDSTVIVRGTFGVTMFARVWLFNVTMFEAVWIFQ